MTHLPKHPIRSSCLAAWVFCAGFLSWGCNIGFDTRPLEEDDPDPGSADGDLIAPDTDLVAPDTNDTLPDQTLDDLDLPSDTPGDDELGDLPPVDTDLAPDLALPFTVDFGIGEGALVPVKLILELNFSDDAERGSAEEAFCLRRGGELGCLPVSWQWSSDTKAKISTNGVLAIDSRHTALMNPTCSAADGRTLAGSGGSACETPAACVRFRTHDSATVQFNPTPGATGVSLTRTVRFNFSEAMAPQSSTMAKLLDASGAQVGASPSWVDSDSLNLDPNTHLAQDTLYCAVLDFGALDAQGRYFVGTGGECCQAPAACSRFKTCKNQEVCSPSGSCEDRLISSLPPNCGGCAQSVPYECVNVGVEYGVPCGSGNCTYRREEIQNCFTDCR